MGNLVSYGGQADSASPENHALGSSALTAAALMAAGKDKAYIQRLSPAELKKYTDGYRRICRADASPSPSPTASPGGNGRSSSVAALPPVPMAALPAKQRSGGVAASQVAVSNAPPAVALPSAIGANTGRLSKKVFRLKLLGAFTMIPHSLSDRLFEVLDTERTGELSCENVLSGIAWLKYGTYEEQVRLLFIIYDLDDAGLVSRDVMDRFMDVVYGRRRARSATTVAFLDRIFAGRTSLTIDEFKLIVRERDERGDALLLQWLSLLADKIGTDEDAKILELERSYNPAVIRQRIAEATLFSVNEVTTLERQFHRLFDTKSGTSNRIPCEQFINVLSARDFPKQLLERVSATTTTLPGAVLFDEFCAFVSHFCRGKIAARYQHLFSIYKDAATATISWAAVNELFALGAHYATTEMDGGEMTRQIEGERLQLDKVIANSSGSDVEGWSEEAFVEWASSATAVQQLLHQLAFAACILFGIKPEAPSLERRIVEWHWKQVTQSIVVGQLWNLVGAKWWQHWCQYVGMNPRNGTPSGALPLPSIPSDDPRVQFSRNDVSLKEQDARSSASDEAPRPGPISNWMLLKRSGSRRLKEQLVFAHDFYLIPSSAYAVLVLWYTGGPDLSRAIVPLPNKTLQIELFPLVLRVARVDPSNGGVIMSGEEVLLSALSTVDNVLEATCKALLLLKVIDKARLWYFDERQPDHKIRIRRDRPTTLTKLNQDCVFLLEVQDEDGSWPLSQSSDKISSSPSNKTNGGERNDVSDSEDEDSDVDESNRQQGGRKRPRDQRVISRTSDICSRGNLESLTGAYSGSTKNAAKNDANTSNNNGGNDKKGEKPGAESTDQMIAASSVVKRRFSKDAFTGHGLVGLDNLGNTCYMSSALQCLSHTRLLVEYFKNEAYLRDINLRNRDGTNGKLAVAFGELLRVLWTSDKKRFAPNEFKRVLAKFNPQFTGSDQHDAQELLAFVLSALSEDLNRIMTKPYTEQPDSDGRSDVIVADEWWQNHLKREVSVIVALFTGQYKSLLECSVCHYESARFEPFTFLQLSLPESSFRSILLTIIFNSGRVPMKYSVRVKHNATIQDVKHEVATFLSRELDKGVVTSSGNNAMIETLKTQLVIARISSLHIIDTILDGRTPLSQIHEKDQLTVFQVDPLESVTTLSLHEAPEKALAKINGNASTASSHRSNSIPTDTKDTKKQQNGVHTNGNTRSQASVTDESMEQEGSQSIEDESEEQEAGEPDDANDDEEAEGGDNHADELLPVGTSVFVRGDKAKEYASARVIGSSAKSGTVDVAYPTGNRRYFVPQGKVIVRQSDEAHIYLVHRRVERSTNSFTNAHITRLFGAPLVLRISLRATSTFDLYIAVWKRLRRIFNWQAPPAPTEFDKSTQSDSEAAEHEGHEKLKADASALALGDHLPVTKFGFCLRMVTSHGTGCSRCEWLEGCLGCLILPSPHEPLQLTAEETIAIDWDIRTLKEEYDPIQASKLDFDNSVQHNKRQDNMPLSIEHCMDMFTAKERIQEAYCGRCKTLRPATKTMDLWRLPPLLVIQLKRFCYTQVSRRKLHHLVDFPLRGLQLENFVAKQREPRRMQESGLQYWRFLGGKLKHEEEEHDAVANKEESRDARIEEGDEDESTRPSTNPLSPSRRESTPLLDAPATAAVRGKDGFLYDLYAVVNHVGALGGGHYFAYVLSEKDGKWKCFNDHQCKDIDETEVASSTAYILFYRRRDTQNMSIEELFPPIVPNSTKHGENSGRDPAEESADQAQVEQLLEQSKLASGGSSCIIS